MPSISKSKLKANMFRIFREIEESDEEWIVTDHNRPVLRIQPIAQKKDRGRGVRFDSGQSHLLRRRQYADHRRMGSTVVIVLDTSASYSGQSAHFIRKLFGNSTFDFADAVIRQVFRGEFP